MAELGNLSVPQGSQTPPDDSTALREIDRRIAGAPVEDLPALTEARERIGRQIQDWKDRERGRMLDTINTITDAALSISAFGIGAGLVIMANSWDKILAGGFIAGAGLYRVAREFVLRRWFGGNDGTEDGQEA